MSALVLFVGYYEVYMDCKILLLQSPNLFLTAA